MSHFSNTWRMKKTHFPYYKNQILRTWWCHPYIDLVNVAVETEAEHNDSRVTTANDDVLGVLFRSTEESAVDRIQARKSLFWSQCHSAQDCDSTRAILIWRQIQKMAALLFAPLGGWLLHLHHRIKCTKMDDLCRDSCLFSDDVAADALAFACLCHVFSYLFFKKNERGNFPRWS